LVGSTIIEFDIGFCPKIILPVRLPEFDESVRGFGTNVVLYIVIFTNVSCSNTLQHSKHILVVLFEDEPWLMVAPQSGHCFNDTRYISITLSLLSSLSQYSEQHGFIRQFLHGKLFTKFPPSKQ
jgi:hypothetical protein